MTENPQPFRVVLRGYEPTQVDQRMQQLAQQAEEARAHAEQLAQRVRVLEQQGQDASEASAAPASYEHLGERVARILELAKEEARDLLERGRSLLDDERQQVSDEVSRQRGEADRYADQT